MIRFSRMDFRSVAPKDLRPKRPLIAAMPKPVVREKRSFNYKRVGSFALLGIMVVSILQGLTYVSFAHQAKGKILGQATSAYSELHDASQNLADSDFNSAQDLFSEAENNLNKAQKELNNFRALTWLVPSASSADKLLSGAGKLAQAGQKLSTALSIFEEIKVSHNGVETINFNQKVSENKQLLSETLNLISDASNDFDDVKSLPSEYSSSLNSAKDQVGHLHAILLKLIDLEDLYLGFFGGQKTYLLVFQNYDEARATGGFIGTYGILKVSDGKIGQLKIESVYNLDGQITKQIAAPGPFQPEIKKWGMRDANWFADFPTSAKKLLEFFEYGSQSADGVLAITPQLFENLLKLTGPIEVPQHGVTLDENNFQDIVQYKTSVDYDRQLNQPKKFLADFAPLLLDHLTHLNKDQWLEFLGILENNLKEKQILLYTKDQDLEKRIDDLGFSGKILSTDKDYLAIVNTNLGGTKTDLDIAQNVDLQSKVLSDGSVINNLTITKKNSAGEHNRDYLRVLVPKGSQFVVATGFEN